MTMQGNVVRDEAAMASDVGMETSKNLFGRPAYEHCSSMEDAVTRAHTMREQCTEIEVPCEKVQFGFDDTKKVITLDLDGLKADPTEFLLEQVGTETGVSPELMTKLTKETLLAALRETWDLTGPRRFLIRNQPEKTPIARCFVGSKYERLWDQQILDSIDTWLLPEGKFVPAVPTINQSFARRTSGGKGGGMKPALFIGDRSSHFFFYSKERDEGNGGMRAGLTVTNSEVGFTKYRYRSFVFMDFCANFIIWSPGKVREWEYVHTKGAVEHGFRTFEQVLRELTDNVHPLTIEVLNQSKTVEIVPVPKNLDEAAVKRADREGLDPWITTRVEAAVKKINRTTGLGITRARAGLQAATLTHNNQGNDPFSIWSVVQGITDAAKDEEFADDQLKMIEQGSSLLDLVKV